jgi:hypothetical protein
MDFGRLPENELNNVDFKLPPDPGFNRNVLSGKPAEKPKVHDEATSPELTVYLVDVLNRVCGLNLEKPKFLD